MAALCWTFIGSAVLCYAYAAYVISCAMALIFFMYMVMQLCKFVWIDPQSAVPWHGNQHRNATHEPITA